MGMDKGEYREDVLKKLRNIEINTEVICLFSGGADVFLCIIMLIALFK